MRYNLKKVWIVGVFILLFLMLESFLGYVLIWRQIRFWACTVITRLLIVIPFFGVILLNWIWGNFYVSILTLKVFFLIHFILPFIIFLIVFFHLNFLHFYTSKRNFYISRNFDKIFFFPFYWIKDLYNIFLIFLLLLISFYFPFVFRDREIFLESNNLLSPVHIIPEWYFLFAYDVLRSISNKVLGVILILLRITIFFYFYLKPFSNFYTLNKIFIFLFFFNIVILRYLGSCLVEDPFINLGVIISIFYFKFILLLIIFF
jgi:ubiquinol-cytochrome c reductase cytochrome b subunit